jgi:hypothetical protein
MDTSSETEDNNLPAERPISTFQEEEIVINETLYTDTSPPPL